MRRLAVVVLFAAFTIPHAGASDPDVADHTIVQVKGRLEAATARFTVRYTITAPKGVARDATTLELPEGGVATGATVIADGVSRVLALGDANGASAKLDRVEVQAGGPSRTSAILIEAKSGRSLEVSVASPRNGAVTLELEISAATCFYRDVRYVGVPDSWKPALAVELRKQYARLDAIQNACAGNSTVWIGFPSPELAKRPALDGRVGAFAARVALDETHFVRVELDVASMLGEVPRDLATAIVVDGSRSLTARQIEVQRALVLSYIDRAPEGRVQLVAFSRTARALLPGWMAATQARTRIERELQALAQRNGSNFDAGLVEAASWLERITGTRRIVLVTDERMAERLANTPPATLRRLLPASTLVHVVVVHSDQEPPARDETTALASLAAATDGMSVRTGLPKEGLDATLLVRPIRLDSIEIKAPGWRQSTALIGGTCGADLGEGESCSWWGEGASLAGPIAIEALAWGRRIVRVVRPDPTLGAGLARELTMLHILDPERQTLAELASRAVNGSSSLYASWGGSHGYADTPSGRILTGHCCMSATPSHSATFGLGHGTKGSAVPKPPLDLKPQLAAGVAGCIGAHDVRASVEVTLSEIVHVEVVALGPQSVASERVKTCVEDAIWDTSVNVPPQFHHATSVVTFEGRR